MGSYSNVNFRIFGSWYQDEAWFLNFQHPWFGRGDHYNRGIGAGIFAFHDIQGQAEKSYSFRIVLAF